MKGRYGGCRMTIYGSVLPGAVSIARSAYLAGHISPKAKGRLKVLDWLKRHNMNVSLTSRHFGLTRETVIRWRNVLVREGPRGLEDRSRRPKKVRVPSTPSDIVLAVIQTRRDHPAWSKHKISVLLKKKGIVVSASTVGRIMKRRGLIDARKSEKRKKAALRPRARFPRGMKISCPGDMVQMDIKHIMLPEGKRHYQFTAIDVLTKQRVLERYPSEASRWGARFLEACMREFPFPIRNIQTDNGSTFQKEFRMACEKYRIPHFFAYPRQPKQQTYVEISHGADKREFYQQGNVRIDPERMRMAMKEWQRVWNEERPHQALNYLTPKEYYEKWQHGRLPTRDVITLQT